MKEAELNEVTIGQAVNGKYYNSLPSGWVQYQIKSGNCPSVIAANRSTKVAPLMTNRPLIDNANVIRAVFWMVVPKK